jgi:hypothetical protein
MSGAARSGGAADPMIHHLSPWTPLITAPEAVVGRFCLARGWIGVAGPLGANDPHSCHVMHRLCSGMPRIASEWRLWRLSGRTSGPIDPSLHIWIKPTFFSESCSSKYFLRERWCFGPGTSHGVGPSAHVGLVTPGGLAVRAHVACWFQFLPKCVPAYENDNTTRGTLLVLKMCMKLVI